MILYVDLDGLDNSMNGGQPVISSSFQLQDILKTVSKRVSLFLKKKTTKAWIMKEAHLSVQTVLSKEPQVTSRYQLRNSCCNSGRLLASYSVDILDSVFEWNLTRRDAWFK